MKPSRQSQSQHTPAIVATECLWGTRPPHVHIHPVPRTSAAHAMRLGSLIGHARPTPTVETAHHRAHCFAQPGAGPQGVSYLRSQFLKVEIRHPAGTFLQYCASRKSAARSCLWRR